MGGALTPPKGSSRGQSSSSLARGLYGGGLQPMKAIHSDNVTIRQSKDIPRRDNVLPMCLSVKTMPTSKEIEFSQQYSCWKRKRVKPSAS